MSQPLTISEFLASENVQQPFATVIGYPISHSLSPLIHNYALGVSGINVSYYPIEVSPDQLIHLTELLRHPNFRGTNVTIPHKRAVIDLIDDVSDTVFATGACNTIFPSDGDLIGENTDVSGFILPLLPYADKLVGKDAIVFGSGGASSAIIHALQKLGMRRIYLVSRSANPGREALTTQMVQIVSYSDWPETTQNVSLFVNTTPLGMHPDSNTSPVRDDQKSLLKDKLCYDIVYRPQKTLFLQQGASQNAQVIDGSEMFLGQAAKAFELFFKQPFPIDAVRPVLYKALES